MTAGPPRLTADINDVFHVTQVTRGTALEDLVGADIVRVEPMVGKERIELSRLAAYDPKSYASAVPPLPHALAAQAGAIAPILAGIW